MKKIFLLTTVAALAFSFTACGDSMDKMVDDAVVAATKCLSGEYDKEKCKQADADITARVNTLTAEQQKEYREKLGQKLKEEWKKIEEEKKKNKK